MGRGGVEGNNTKNGNIDDVEKLKKGVKHKGVCPIS